MPSEPTIGAPLPRASEAFGIADKLTAYCLNVDHELGAAKARAFERALGITAGDVDHLADALRTGVVDARVSAVRDNAPFGLLCEVRIPVAGVRGRTGRVVDVTTSWELRKTDDRPRLVTAYIDG